MEVRHLGSDDVALGVDAIRLLKSPDGYPVPSAAYLSTFLSRAENVLIVAADDGAPVGFILAYLLDRVDRDQRMAFFYEIGVAPSHPGRGIGRQLIAGLKAICRAHDVMKMWVSTSHSNIAAMRLYASTDAAPCSSPGEVTYSYPRESFVDQGRD